MAGRQPPQRQRPVAGDSESRRGTNPILFARPQDRSRDADSQGTNTVPLHPVWPKTSCTLAGTDPAECVITATISLSYQICYSCAAPETGEAIVRDFPYVGRV